MKTIKESKKFKSLYGVGYLKALEHVLELIKEEFMANSNKECSIMLRKIKARIKG